MLSRPASDRPKSEMSGLAAAGSTWRNRTRRLRDAVRARRAHERRVQRPATPPGRAGRRTGRMPEHERGRRQHEVRRPRPRTRATAPTSARAPSDVIPPAGNQPVRTASSSRPSASTMSGTASSSAVSPAERVAPRAAAPASPTRRRGEPRGARRRPSRSR